MSTATLGVAINSGPAKQGAEEVKQALSSVEATAARTTTAMTAASTAVGQKLTQQANAVRALTGVTTTHATAAQTSAVAIRAEAKALDDGLGALRAMQQATTAALASLQSKTAAMTATTTATSAATVATGLFRGAVASMGGPLGIALIALQAIPMVLDKVREAKEKAAKQAEAYTKAIKDMSPAAREAAISLEQQFQAQLRTERRTGLGERRERDELIAQSNARIKVLQQVQGEQQRVDGLARSESLGKMRREMEDTAAASERFRVGGEKASAAYLKAAGIWDSTAKSTKSFTTALAEGDTYARQLLGTSERLGTVTGGLKNQQDAAKKAAEEHAKALKEQEKEAKRVKDVLDDIFMAKKKYAEQLADLGKKEDEQARREIERLAERRERAKETADSIIAGQRRELQAFGQTLDAIAKMNIENGATDLRKQLQELDPVAREAAIKKWREQQTAIEANNKALREHEQALARVGQTAAGLSNVVDAVTGIAAAFGGVNSEIEAALRGSSSLLSNLAQAQRAGIYRDESTGLTKNVGFGGAIAGQAGLGPQLAAITSAVSIVGTVVGTFRSIVGSMDAAQRAEVERRNALNRQFAEAVAVFDRSVREGGMSTVQREQGNLQKQIADMVAAAVAATGANMIGTQPGTFRPTGEGVRELQSIASFVAAGGGKGAESLRAFAEQLDRVAKLAEEAEASLRREQAERFAVAQEDVRVSILRAQGRDAEANAMQRQLDLNRQLAAAEQQFRGLEGLTEYLEQLKTASKLAAEAAEAEAMLNKQRQASDFINDMAARQQRRAGNEAGAFGIETAASGAKATREAEDLYKAGIISLEILEQFKVLIGQEMAEAMTNFTKQAEEAKRQIEEMAKQKEQERIAAIQAAHEDITRRQIEALKVLNPALAESMELEQKEIERKKELAAASDDVIRGRLEELFLMQDQAAMMLKAAAAAEQATRALQAQVEAQIAAANAFRDIQSTINDEFLRATGRGFEADRLKLGASRDERIAQLMSSALATLGPAPTVRGMNDFQGMAAMAQWQAQYAQIMQQVQENVDKVNSTYSANLDRLIASQMSPSASTPTGGLSGGGSAFTPATGSPNIPILGEDSISVRSARSITESSAMRLVDYSAAQLAVQREILAELKGRGVRNPDLLASPLDTIDRALGNRVRNRTMLGAGRVR